MARKKNTMPSGPLPQVDDPPTAGDLSFLQFIEGKGHKVGFIDPLSDEGLRLQALYVQNFSQHPLDVVRRVMENPFSDPKDRLASAKLLLEYSARKPTQSLDLNAKGAVLNIDPTQLSALNAEELDLLEKLLSKAG